MIKIRNIRVLNHNNKVKKIQIKISLPKLIFAWAIALYSILKVTKEAIIVYILLDTTFTLETFVSFDVDRLLLQTWDVIFNSLFK